MKLISIQDLKAKRSAMVAQMLSSVIRVLEARRNLIGLASNLLPAVTTPRSLDLAHLRSALWFHAAERINRFVTMDSSQEEAARELGLPV